MVTFSRIFKEQFNRVLDFNDINVLQVGSFAEWDSLSHFSFLVLIEETYNVQFSVEEMSEIKSLKAIIDVLKTKGIEVII